MEESTSSQASASNIDLSNLTNAIVQIFTIILLGYVAGRAEIISKVHAAGIGRFVSRFCLPALIFRNMCLLKFTGVNWAFVLGIFLAKVSLFLLVVVTTLVMKRPSNLGLAGIFAVFTIQSNDFAFGYPIVQAIYGKIQPEYTKYIYLVAPISLAFLNPIGFIMMEFQNTMNAREHGENAGFCKALFKVMKGISLNPIVNMTVAGIVFNFILGGSIPEMADDIFKVLAQGFNAGALFFLGLSLVGKVQGNFGISLLVPFLLVVAKSLLLPLFAWGILQRLDHSENSTSLSMYGFLYGTIPTTPSLYIFANDFGFGQDIIATALVLGNAVAAPLTFVSAKMMTVYVDKEQDFKKLLNDTSFDLSIVWVIVLFILTGKWKKIPHHFTMAYMVSIVISCIGVFVFHVHGAVEGWHSYPGMVLLMVGVLASRFWTANMAFVLCILHVRSLPVVQLYQMWFFLGGFGLPMMMAGIQFILAHEDVAHEINPSFHYGKCQAIFSLSALLVSLSVTVASLVWWQRYNRHHPHHEGHVLHQTANGDTFSLGNGKDNIHPGVRGESIGAEPSLPESRAIGTPPDSPKSGSAGPYKISATEHTPIMGNIQEIQRQVPNQNERSRSESAVSLDKMSEYQSVKHLILILPLIFSMFVGVILCTWKILKGTATGTLIEIEFLDIVLNYGQGILVALVFGFESAVILSPMLRRFWDVLMRTKIQVLPRVSGLEDSTVESCDQFTKYHLERCYEEIVRDRRVDSEIQQNVFTGTALCDYLLRCGLVKDRSNAVVYGSHLLLGRVITSVNTEQNFHDALSNYKFLKSYTQLP